jgi:large subunit ribosomal protein L20
MPRTKTGTTRKARHNKVLNLTKGFRGANTRLFKRAHEALLHAGQYAFIGRKLRKRDMRALWITRISAAIKQIDMAYNYSKFMKDMKTARVELNRKMLAEIAVNDFSAFTKVVSKVRSKLA